MNTLTFLKQIGTPDDLRRDAGNGIAPQGRPKNNSHIHLPPNFSAFESISDAVNTAAAENIGVLGASNYYYYEIYEQFASLATAAGILPLFGLEIISQVDEIAARGHRINDPGNPGRMYICGKSISRFAEMSPAATQLISTIRWNDAARMQEMTRKLASLCRERGFDTAMDYKNVVNMITLRHKCEPGVVIPQERHIAQAFQEHIFAGIELAQRQTVLSRLLGVEYSGKPDDAVKVQGDIRSHLMKSGKPAFVEEKFLSFEQAYKFILELGGIPCYPTLADGASKPCEFEESADSLVAELKKKNIVMAEFIPLRNKPEVLEKYVQTMRKAGIVVVAGTEHNTLDRLPIEPFCVNAQPISTALRSIFWEGACVTIAHLFLNAHGECGFVDETGAPNKSFTSDESRITAFSRLGAAVTARFQHAFKPPAV